MVCESVRYCIIEKVNFVVKVLCRIRILASDTYKDGAPKEQKEEKT